MLLKNDKIKMVKDIGVKGFSVGDEFVVEEVNENGSFTFCCSAGRGLMSMKEFEEFFEKVVEIKKAWSEWVSRVDSYNVPYKFKTNCVTVIVEQNGYRSQSTCKPEDKFNLWSGINLCLAKIYVKQAQHNLDTILQLM